MTFSGKESLEVAQYLVGQASGPCTEESARRAAISRAYFAAYGHAFHYAVEKNRFKPEGGSRDHTNLRVHYAKAKKDTIVASELEELRIWRNMSDYYKNYIGPLSSNVTSALNNAKDIINRLK
mgnify:CR=1 FL=1|jgi:hypothetical protein